MKSFSKVLGLKWPYIVGGIVFAISAILQSFVFGGFVPLLTKSIALGGLWIGISFGVLIVLNRYVPNLYKLGFPEEDEGSTSKEVGEFSDSDSGREGGLDLTVDDDIDVEGFEFSDKPTGEASVAKKPSSTSSQKKSTFESEESRNKVLDELSQQDTQTIAKAVRHVMNE